MELNNYFVFKADSLDGVYILVIDNNTFSVSTSIDSFDDIKTTKLTPDFIKELNSISFGDSLPSFKNTFINIEDAVKYEISFLNENKIHHFDFQEGDFPYHYDELIVVLSKLDKNILMFKANN